jgi:hypothetical protein
MARSIVAATNFPQQQRAPARSGALAWFAIQYWWRSGRASGGLRPPHRCGSGRDWGGSGRKWQGHRVRTIAFLMGIVKQQANMVQPTKVVLLVEGEGWSFDCAQPIGLAPFRMTCRGTDPALRIEALYVQHDPCWIMIAAVAAQVLSPHDPRFVQLVRQRRAEPDLVVELVLCRLPRLLEAVRPRSG